MTRVIAPVGGAAQVFSGPPSDRMSGRPSRAQASVRAQSGARVSAALRANLSLGREALLDQAIHAGLINAGMRDHYGQCFDADPEGTRTYISQLGHSQAPGAAVQGAAASGDDYEGMPLTNVERSRVAAAREGRPHGRIISGG